MNYKDFELRVEAVSHYGAGLSLLKMKAEGPLPEILPGQFVNVLAPKRAGVLLRRPISVCNVADGLLLSLIHI